MLYDHQLFIIATPSTNYAEMTVKALPELQKRKKDKKKKKEGTFD